MMGQVIKEVVAKLEGEEVPSTSIPASTTASRSTPAVTSKSALELGTTTIATTHSVHKAELHSKSSDKTVIKKKINSVGSAATTTSSTSSSVAPSSKVGKRGKTRNKKGETKAQARAALAAAKIEARRLQRLSGLKHLQKLQKFISVSTIGRVIFMCGFVALGLGFHRTSPLHYSALFLGLGVTTTASSFAQIMAALQLPSATKKTKIKKKKLNLKSTKVSASPTAR